MAEHYKGTIADALQAFDNYAHSRQFYLDLAWEGLRYSDISSWSDLSSEEKSRINNAISIYISENSNQICK